MKNKAFLIFLLTAVLMSGCEKNKVTSLVITEKTLNLTMGSIHQLEVIVYPLEAASNASISWLSSDGSIATINNDGIVTAISAGTAEIIVSSGDITATCTVTVTPVQLTMTFTSATLFYLGDELLTGTNQFRLKLLTDTLSIDSSEQVTGSGYYLNIACNLSTQDTTLAAGDYKTNTNGSAYSFYPGSMSAVYSPGSYLGIQNSNGTSSLSIKKGQMTVIKNNDIYTITTSLTGADGEVITGTFTDTIDIINISKKNFKERTLNFNNGDVYMSLNNDSSFQIFKTILQNESDTLQLLFNVSLGIAGKLPVGTYQIAEQFSAFTALKGLMTPDHKGTWWFNSDVKSPILSGTISVSHNTEYLLKYNLISQNKTRLIGQMQGSLNFN